MILLLILYFHLLSWLFDLFFFLESHLEFRLYLIYHRGNVYWTLTHGLLLWVNFATFSPAIVFRATNFSGLTWASLLADAIGFEALFNLWAVTDLIFHVFLYHLIIVDIPLAPLGRLVWIPLVLIVIIIIRLLWWDPRGLLMLEGCAQGSTTCDGVSLRIINLAYSLVPAVSTLTRRIIILISTLYWLLFRESLGIGWMEKIIISFTTTILIIFLLSWWHGSSINTFSFSDSTEVA